MKWLKRLILGRKGATNNHSKLKVSVEIRDMDIWEDIIGILKDVVEDDRISDVVRKEYLNRIDNIVEDNTNDEREFI